MLVANAPRKIVRKSWWEKAERAVPGFGERRSRALSPGALVAVPVTGSDADTDIVSSLWARLDPRVKSMVNRVTTGDTVLVWSKPPEAPTWRSCRAAPPTSRRPSRPAVVV